MLDAVGAGGGEVVERGLAEAVRRHPRALLVGRGDRVGEDVDGPAGSQVAGVAVDPVADQLDPAVARLRLDAHAVDELVRLDLVGVVADVAAGPGDVPPRPDDLGQVLALVDPPRVRRRAGVADEQRARVAVGERLGLGGRRRRPRRGRRDRRGSARRPARAGHTRARSARRPRTRGPLEGQPAADDPRLAADVLGSDEDLAQQMQHRCRHGADPSERTSTVRATNRRSASTTTSGASVCTQCDGALDGQLAHPGEQGAHRREVLGLDVGRLGAGDPQHRSVEGRHLAGARPASRRSPRRSPGPRPRRTARGWPASARSRRRGAGSAAGTP